MTASGGVWSELAACVGPAHALHTAEDIEPYCANASGLVRDVAGVVRPASTSEVQQVVAAANRHRLPLYPFSKGRNWGLGSRLPVRDGACLVDLGRMNRIREVNVSGAYAVVEPGVTQEQLHAHLVANGLPLMMNVIGSGLQTSLLGNALERGIGYFSTRAGSLTGMEVVLGNGTLLHTGFGHLAGARTTHVYAHGIGPSLEGLFYQSNFGIVCAAGVELMHDHGVHRSLIVRLGDGARLPALVDAMASLRQQDIVRMVVHIGNRARSWCTLAPLLQRQLGAGTSRAEVERVLAAEGFGPWSAVASLRGTPGAVAEAAREVRRTLSAIAPVMELDEHKLARARRLLNALSFVPALRRKAHVLEAVAPVNGLALGVPTDAALASVFWAAGVEVPAAGEADPDCGVAGQLYFLPMLPLDGREAVRAVEVVAQVTGRHGIQDPPMTLNVLDARCLEMVLSLPFRRDRPEQVASAHACLAELEQRFLADGLPPYRVGISSMPRIVQPGDAFWETAAALKRVMDPNEIIAPGRYNLL